MANARVRGIYSTALTKLLLDSGFKVVQPSLVMKERFGVEEDREPPDLEISDRPDRQGVKALGKADAIEKFISILKKFLSDAILRKGTVSAGGIYKGIVKKIDPKHHVALIDIGSAFGALQLDEAPNIRLGDILIQVDRNYARAKVPALTTKISILGNYAILISDGHVRVSRKILDRNSRDRLCKLGEELKTEWGILWRTAAENQPPDVLRSEIAYLMEKGKIIKERAERLKAPSLVYEGRYYLDAEFPALSKKKLDAIRSSITPTIPGHHYYKACGGNIASAVDMAEKLLSMGHPLKEVEDLFLQTVTTEFPIEDSTVTIEHVKLDGRVFHLGKALVETYDRDKSIITLRRTFETNGIYDGFETPKETGDYAITEIKVNEWYVKTQYFSRDGRQKGIYINVNTPVELYPTRIRYVDLEIDICVFPNGEIKILDEKKLEEQVEKGTITIDLLHATRSKLNDILESLGKPSSLKVN
ncbi:DUF402 domain-containing protein [Candidatus Bathyarchaeota archaeon]|nr:DUF402 domain-containing protein [Candidatus Bathyarchaeota archaeon]